MQLKPIDIEQKILKLMFTSYKIYIYIENKLRKKHFSSKEHRAIFHFLQNYYRTFGKIATCKIFLKEVLNKKQKKVVRYKLILRKILKENIELREAPYYIGKIIDSFKARKFLVNIYTANQQIEEGNIDRAINNLQEILTNLQQEGADSIIREGRYLDGIRNRGKELLNKDYYFGNYIGVPTGLKTFDDCLGGLYPEEFGVIVGGSGKGKSIMLLNLAVNASKLKLPVVIVTLEISKMQYEYRLDSLITGIEQNKFRKKELEKSDFRNWIHKMKKIKKRGEIFIIDIPTGATTRLIEMKLQEAMRSIKSKRFLLIVDYLNLLLPNKQVRGGSMEWQSLGEVSKDLKELARKLHIPIWSAAQFPKSKANKKVLTLEDIGFSYKIGMDSDVVLALLQTQEMEEEGVLKIVCLKGREGKIPVIECYPDFKRMRLNDKDAEEEDNE